MYCDKCEAQARDMCICEHSECDMHLYEQCDYCEAETKGAIMRGKPACDSCFDEYYLRRQDEN